MLKLTIKIEYNPPHKKKRKKVKNVRLLQFVDNNNQLCWSLGYIPQTCYVGVYFKSAASLPLHDQWSNIVSTYLQIESIIKSKKKNS